jgi:hypothetical protein
LSGCGIIIILGSETGVIGEVEFVYKKRRWEDHEN